MVLPLESTYSFLGEKKRHRKNRGQLHAHRLRSQLGNLRLLGGETRSIVKTLQEILSDPNLLKSIKAKRQKNLEGSTHAGYQYVSVSSLSSDTSPNRIFDELPEPNSSGSLSGGTGQTTQDLKEMWKNCEEERKAEIGKFITETLMHHSYDKLMPQPKSHLELISNQSQKLIPEHAKLPVHRESSTTKHKPFFSTETKLFAHRVRSGQDLTLDESEMYKSFREPPV